MDALRRRLAELVASGDMAGVLSLVGELATKVESQGNEIARLRKLVYDRRGEKLTLEELGQLLLAYGATEAEEPKKKSRKGGTVVARSSRQAWSASSPRCRYRKTSAPAPAAAPR